MAFTEKQIEFMKELGLNFDFSKLSDGERCEIEEQVGNELILHCLDENYEPNKRGLICEDILRHIDD